MKIRWRSGNFWTRIAKSSETHRGFKHFSIFVFPIRGSRDPWIEFLFTSCRNEPVTHNIDDDKKAQKAFLFFVPNRERIRALIQTTLELTITASHRSKTQPPFYRWNRKCQPAPSMEEHSSTHKYQLSLLTIFHFLPYPFVEPPVYIWADMGAKREKSAKKWSFFCRGYLFCKSNIAILINNAIPTQTHGAKS